MASANGKTRVSAARKAVDPQKLRVGQLIKRARNAAGWSQADLAKRIGVTAGAIGQWEIGYSNLGRTKLIEVSRVLNLPLGSLLDEAGIDDVTLSPRTRETVELDGQLVAEARLAGIEVEPELARHLRDLVGKARAKRWLSENREALADANAFLTRHGLWSDGKRQF